MKTLIRTLLAVAAGGLLAIAPARAQTIANGNFETWATRYGVQLPTNWLTFDDLLGGALPTGTVSRTTVAHGGAAAVQIQTQTLPGLGQIPGYLILGTAFRGGPTFPAGCPSRAGRAACSFTTSSAAAGPWAIRRPCSCCSPAG